MAGVHYVTDDRTFFPSGQSTQTTDGSISDTSNGFQFAPCGCCGSSGTCPGSCSPSYLTTDASFATGFGNGGLPKCFTDQFGNVYNLTSSGWVDANGDIITYNCLDNQYYVNGIPATDPSNPFNITASTETCTQADTCCSTYPNPVYMHITSDDCSWLNQVVLLTLDTAFNQTCRAPAYGSHGNFCYQPDGGGYGELVVFCDNYFNNFGANATFGGYNPACASDMPDPCFIFGSLLPNIETESSFFSIIPFYATSISCSPFDVVFSDIPYKMYCANINGSTTVTSSPAIATTSCCGTFNISWSIDGSGNFIFTISSATNTAFCKCCTILNGSYVLIPGGIGPFEGWSADGGAISGTPLGTVPDPYITAGYSSGDAFNADALIINYNKQCLSNCHITFEITSSMMMMMQMPLMQNLPDHIKEHLTSDSTTEDQKAFLLNKINNKELPEPVKEAPSIIQKIKTAASAGVQHVTGGMELVSEQEEASRIAKCEGCEYFLKNSRTCSQCGCMVDIKVKMPYEGCPLLKWLPTKFPEKPKSQMTMLPKPPCGGCGKK